MKNIFKYLLVALVGSFFLTSCDNEADRNWTTQEPSFVLHDTTLGASVLYVSMESNPFILTWDKANTTGSYSIVVSADEEFENKVVLGTSETTTFRTTIGDLNTAMLQAGLNPYSAQTAYVRVEAGSGVSNAISFTVTPYPSEAPIITNPTAGASLVLSGSTADEEAIEIAWNDYETYGSNVDYLVEIAAKGSTEFYPLGTSINAKTLSVSHLVMDQAVLKTGAQANAQSEFDLRVTAISKSIGGTISKVSELVTFKVVPYELVSYMYAPGGYQGWSPETANTLVSATSNGIYEGIINFTEANSEFKITPERTWTNSYGTDDNVNLIYNGGGNLKNVNSGHQKLKVDINTLTFSLERYSWGIIGNATPGGWDNDTDLVWNDATQTWDLSNIALNAGELKFRLNDGWDTNYGGSGGIAVPGGDNIAIPEAGNYKVSLDLVNLKYTLTKL